MGWKISGTLDENIKKCVLMVLPHTANSDFFIGLFTRGIMGMEMNFVAKKELFVFPLNYYFKSVGGAALDRSGGKNLVDTIVDIFETREIFRLAIAPEGTRKKVEQLKTGFYYIAQKASVPIITVAFDYGKKEVRLGKPFTPTGNYEADLKILVKFFKGVKGKFPERQIKL
ncbi:1-acyl-sn-glycerol-3-phosphate acyltransferase [Flavobacterium sp.]